MILTNQSKMLDVRKEIPARDIKSNTPNDASFTPDSVLRWQLFYKTIFSIDLKVTDFNFNNTICHQLDTDIAIINNQLSINTILDAYSKYIAKVLIASTDITNYRQNDLTQWYYAVTSPKSKHPGKDELGTTLTLRECLLIDLKHRFCSDEVLVNTTNTIVCTGSQFAKKHFPHIGIIGTTLIIDTVDILDDNDFQYFTVKRLSY